MKRQKKEWNPDQPFADLDPGVAKRFLQFHSGNPHVYREFHRHADEALRAGHHRSSAKLIVNVIRWDHAIRTRATDGFKINDRFHAYYARLWLSEHRDHPEFFELRQRGSRCI